MNKKTKKTSTENNFTNLDLTDFQLKCKNALTIEEARTKTINFIKNLPWKK